MSSPNPKPELNDYVVVHLPDGLSQCRINDVRCAGITDDVQLPFASDICKALRQAHDGCVRKIFIRLNNALSSTWKSSHGD